MRARSRFSRSFLLLLVLATGASASFAQTPHPPAPTPQTYADLVYATFGGRPLALDLRVPPGAAKPVPLIIYIHGGGWCMGAKNSMPAPLLKMLDLGFAVASIDYRLTSQAGQWGGEPVTFPAQIHDVKGAVRFLRANATKYHLDPDRFAALGDSAGGHLSALLATSGGVPELEGTVGGNLGVSSRVQVAVDYYGPTDMLHLADDVTTITDSTARRLTAGNPIAMLAGYNPKIGESIALKDALTSSASPFPEFRRRLALANPIAFVDPSDPPLFIAHATGDSLVPVGQSLRLEAALKKAGVKTELMITQGGGHGNLSGPTHNAALRFICDALNPEAARKLAEILKLMAPQG